MSEWRPIETAPKDGSVFLALNHDREVWASKINKDGRTLFRSNGRYEPKRYEHVIVDGETLLREDKEFAAKHEAWRSDWTIWTRLYEFKPTHWMPLPEPPQ